MCREPGWTRTGVRRDNCAQVGKSLSFLRSHTSVWMILHSTMESLSYWAPLISSLFCLENTQKQETSSFCFHDVYSLIGEITLTYKQTVNLPSSGVSSAPDVILGGFKKERWILVQGQFSSTHPAGERERVDTSLNQKQIRLANGSCILPYLLHQTSRGKRNFSYLYREDSYLIILNFNLFFNQWTFSLKFDVTCWPKKDFNWR